MSQKIPTIAYRTAQKQGMYLFVHAQHKWEDLPEALRQQFISPEEVTRFEMTPERRLANADGKRVWEALHTNGFYLQMPSDKAELVEDRWIAEREAGTGH